MRCWGCRVRMKEGAWFFTDAPPGKKLALCELCHKDSKPSQARREWRPLGRQKAGFYRGGAATNLPLVNNKVPFASMHSTDN